VRLKRTMKRTTD